MCLRRAIEKRLHASVSMVVIVGVGGFPPDALETMSYCGVPIASSPRSWSSWLSLQSVSGRVPCPRIEGTWGLHSEIILLFAWCDTSSSFVPQFFLFPFVVPRFPPLCSEGCFFFPFLVVSFFSIPHNDSLPDLSGFLQIDFAEDDFSLSRSFFSSLVHE